MQVSAIIPILLNIIRSEQQNPKQAPREQTAFKELLQGQPARPPAAAPEAGEKAAPRPGGGESSEPALLPLPLRSPLFPETQFYIFRRPEDKPGREGQEGETGIVFSLATLSLGRLFFMLTRKAEGINIVCHAENNAAAERLNTRARELSDQVRETGFDRVSFRCTVLDPKLARVPGGFSSPGLLDRKV